MRVARTLVTSVVMLALLAFFGYAAYWGYQQFKAPGPAPSTTACVSTDVGAKLTPDKVTIRILNGGTVGGLARKTNTYLRAFGFRVIRVNNTDERITTTTIVGNSENDPEVKLLMGFFPGSVARGDGRTDHIVDVLVGQPYTALAKPPTSVPVNGPVCLPAIPSPSPTPTPTTPAAKPPATKK